MNKRSIYRTALLLLAAAAALLSCTHQPARDTLREGFINPPDSARPGVYWYFMDGNLDSAAMTADLESMKKAGIGYVLFLEVNVGVPRGKVDFLSEEWQSMYKHAVREAERLGIRIVLGSGPGWAGSGGPWVTPEKSMSHLVASEKQVTGPGNIKITLAVPDPKRPFFGEESLTPELKKIRDGWYEDVAVLAFPSPENDRRISDIDNKALYYRAPYTSQPGVLPFIVSPLNYPDQPGTSIDPTKITDLSDRLKPDGTLEWTVPAGKWTIMRFGKRNNGAVTRPAPAPGLGFEADKFDTASFNDHYNTYIGKLIDKVRPGRPANGGGWTMIHIDSWEMGAQNWRPHFREEFIKRRGYDPQPWLPVYRGFIVNSAETSERFLWDVRQTASELVVENHALQFKRLGRRSGFRLSVEPYDMNPSADLDLGGTADVPMCEFWSNGYGFSSSFSCFESTSIAHTRGLPVVAAEAFTADSPEAWKQHPASMKDQGDWAFCVGINRFFYHTFAHKPLPGKYLPGMTMGPYGVHWDRGQTWWQIADGYHKYVTRCQYILSQGKAVSDILYLTPEGAPQVFLPPKSALAGSSFMPDRKGFAFDGCSPVFLMKNAGVTDNRLEFPGGGSYNLLVLPATETMTPELLLKIEELVTQGAILAGNPPEKSPSLVNYPDCDAKVNEIAARIWGGGATPEGLQARTLGKGRIYWGTRLLNGVNVYSEIKDSLNIYPPYSIADSLLRTARIIPDFRASSSIRYTHRSLEDREIYFISSKKDETIKETCIFRNGSPAAELWDAVTGRISRIRAERQADGSFAARIKLEPFQSFFVVFSKDTTGIQNSTVPFEYFKESTSIATLEGPWKVSFDTAWGGPANTVFERLTDWTGNADEGIKYYSGTAVYRLSFDLKGAVINKSDRYFIDLGKVRNMCRVSINGSEPQVVWTSPWQIDATGLLRENDNELEITVANLWPNRLIGDEKEPWDGVENDKWPDWLLKGTKRPSKRFTFTTHRFYHKDDPLLESGLLGPVTVRSTTPGEQ